MTDTYLASLGDRPVYVFLADTRESWAQLSGKVSGVLVSDVPGYLAYRRSVPDACPT